MLSAVLLLLLLAPLAAGCNSEAATLTTSAPAALAAAATGTTAATASVPTPTGAQAAQPTASPVPSGTPQAQGSETPQSTPTGPTGTPTVRPTPTGAPPSDPVNLLNVFNFFPSTVTLVKRDALDLNRDGTKEMLVTIAAPAQTITGEAGSALAILKYDPKYREWNLTWQVTPVPGTASPLPAANRIDGYNGGDLLKTGDPIFALRTVTRDARSHLYLWRWNAKKGAGERLQMVPVGGGAARDTDFVGDLDVNLADLDGDGVYDVIADNMNGVQIWKWDGSKFVPGGNR